MRGQGCVGQWQILNSVAAAKNFISDVGHDIIHSNLHEENIIKNKTGIPDGLQQIHFDQEKKEEDDQIQDRSLYESRHELI